MAVKAVFFDKDGTIVDNVPYNVDPGKIRLMPGAGEELFRLKEKGYKLIVITNQSGLARGFFSMKEFLGAKKRLEEMLFKERVVLDAFYCCFHRPEEGCGCRKPSPGLLWKAALRFKIRLDLSWLVGDILDDVEAGKSAGCKTILFLNNSETEWRISDRRSPDFVVEKLEEIRGIIK